MGELKIADLAFRVTRCELVAFVDVHEDRLSWGVEVETEPREVLEGSWQPRATCDVAFQVVAPGRPWRDVLPRRVSVPEPPDGDVPALLYVFEHEPIRGNVVDVRRSGDRLGVVWTGRCDVHFDERYGADLPFAVSSPITGCVVLSGRDPEVEGRRRLSRYLDDTWFRYVVDEHGVSTFAGL